MSKTWFFQDLMGTIAEQGRQLLPAALFGGADGKGGVGLQGLVAALMSGQGEASGVAIAQQVLKHYDALEDDAQRSAFLRYLGETLKPKDEAVSSAARAYLDAPGRDTLEHLQRACESPRQEFFRRLNLAPGGTHQIVRMRADLLRLARDASPDERACLDAVDRDLIHLLQSWFNRGFLMLRRIDWRTPAIILDKIVQYEAVHAIDGWDDLKRRLDPIDRRCFAFFHPSLIDEPLIFVEVALTNRIAGSIAEVLDEPPKTARPETPATTAVFYSISNCQAGLRGISFGNFLIKQVVSDLVAEHPELKTFVTLSPVPTFARWLDAQQGAAYSDQPGADNHAQLAALADPHWHDDADAVTALQTPLLEEAARYFLEAKTRAGLPLDPVARFHLGNGARLERINMLGDVSPKGLAQAHGLMVNYLYEPRDIEKNHEAFVNNGEIACSRGVRSLLKAKPVAPPAGRQKAIAHGG